MIAGTFVTCKGKLLSVGYPEFVEHVAFYSTETSAMFHPLSTFWKDNLPTLAICETVDGSREHAVTFFGNWIFDSNEKKALPISPESLNRCAPNGFIRIFKAWKFGMHLYTSKGHKRKRQNKHVSI